jgi:predicted dehydrogenase
MGSDARIEMDTAFEYRGQRLRLSRKSERDPKAESSEEIVLGQQDQFALEMDHMAERVGQGDVPPFTPGEEGLQDHRLMAAIYQAASSGRTVRLEAPEGRDVFRGPAPSES